MSKEAKKTLVIYHANCMDGFTAAWVAWLKYKDEAEYLPANYGDPPPDVEGRDVLVLDFSYPRAAMVAMADAAASILVIDHHKTAQAALEGLDFVRFDMDRSGAGLTWDTLFSGHRPWIVDYVEDRDLWRFRLPHSREVNAWIGVCERGSLQDWGFLAENVADAREKGAAVLRAVGRYVREMAQHVRMVVFEGTRVPVVNAPYINISEVLSHLAESAPFAVGWFQRGDGLFQYSLRSRGEDGVDVSDLARRYGGGGHHNSAGFVTKTMLVLPNVP